MANALAKQQMNNLHILLFLRLIYLQISKIYCIILTEETLYSNKYDIQQTSVSKKENDNLNIICFNKPFARLCLLPEHT